MERQIYKEATKQVRVDGGLHKILRIKSAEQGITLKALLQQIIESQIESILE